jgi:hypothetical protein
MNACAEPIDQQSPLSTLTMGKLQSGRRAGNVQIAAAYLRLAGTRCGRGPQTDTGMLHVGPIFAIPPEPI